MRYVLAIVIITFLSKLFIYSYAENISDEKFYRILEEAKVLYKGIDQGRDCVWDYHNAGSEYFNIRNQQHKFVDKTFYSFGCVYGMYNYWSVWMKEDTDGSLQPLTFAYPFYVNSIMEGQEDPSLKLGMSTTRMLCNPTVDEEEMTITTKCLGRGVGDYFDSGIWKYIGSDGHETDIDIKDDFLLIKFESDGKDDGIIKPIILYEVSD